MFFLSNSIQSEIDIRDVLSYEKWRKKTVRYRAKKHRTRREKRRKRVTLPVNVHSEI